MYTLYMIALSPINSFLEFILSSLFKFNRDKSEKEVLLNVY